MSDWKRIVEYMKTHKGITCKECERDIGTTELRRRICDLREKGYNITEIWEEGVNRVGVKTRFKRYYLLSEPIVIEKQPSPEKIDILLYCE